METIFLFIIVALFFKSHVHIVEQLITERAPKLTGRPKLFKALKPLIYRLLAYDAAVFLADNVAHKTGLEAFNMLAQHIDPHLNVEGLGHIPKTGGCVVIANHPTGLADGLAVFKALRERRPDHIFLANADALRVMPHCEDIIIPVEWVKDKRTTAKSRATLVKVKAALKAEKCVVIFPSGALAKMTFRGLVDKPWQNSAAMIATKYQTPIIPLKIEARNSALYYLFAKLNSELRDITLFHELLNKKGQTFKMKFGPVIDPATLPKNTAEATAAIRHVVETL